MNPAHHALWGFSLGFAFLSVGDLAIKVSAQNSGELANRVVKPNPQPDQPNSGTRTGRDSVNNNGLTWSIEPPLTTWNLTRNDEFEFVVTVSNEAGVDALRVMHSTITDLDTGRAINIPASAFGICSSVNQALKDCRGTIDKPSQSPEITSRGETTPAKTIKRTLWLKVDRALVPNGVFSGTLTLDTNLADDSKNLSLTLQRTSNAAKVEGLVLLTTGVALAWFVTVFARSRLNRDQALLPVILLTQKLTALRTRLAAVPQTFKPDITLTPGRIGTVENDLDPANLDGLQLLPPRLPGWTQSANTQSIAYQNFIQLRSQLVEDLDIVVTGIESAASILSSTPTTNQGDLHSLIAKLDALSATLPQDANVLRNQVQNLIHSYNAGTGPQALGSFAQAPTYRVAGPTAMNAVSVLLQMQSLTLLFWIVWGMLSVIVGFTVLIQSAPGFGVYADFIRCCLWGFGLPVAGQGLQQLTMSSVNTQLGVTIPK